MAEQDSLDIANQVEFNVIRGAAEQIEYALNPKKAISEILSIISRQMGLNRGRVLLQDTTLLGYLHTAYAYGLTLDEISRGKFAMREGICGKVMYSGTPSIVPDIDLEDDYLFRSVDRSTLPQEPVSFIATPIMRNNTVVGVLAVNRLRNRHRLLDKDLSILKLIALFISEILAVHHLLEQQTQDLKEENELLKSVALGQGSQYGIIGESPILMAALNKVSRAANTSVTVLLKGESGTGKEKFARMLHLSSHRRDAPFIAINCAAIPLELLESELFGYEKGAFTGALKVKPGKLELADQGTLFLDEIADLDFGLQAKLLRVLEERVITRVGGTKSMAVDVRIIVASHKDLHQAVNIGKFRLDLFYRLNVFPIDLPPLRQRQGDIRLLVRFFLNQSNQEYQTSVIFDREAILFLEVYSWPGNIRQLENVVKRSVLLADDRHIISTQLVERILAEERGIDHLSPVGAKPLVAVEPSSMVMPLHHISSQLLPSADHNNARVGFSEEEKKRHYWRVSQYDIDQLKFAFNKARGNKRQAALILEMTPRQFNYRVKKLGLVL
jgi:Nif-specific regulatory protein